MGTAHILVGEPLRQRLYEHGAVHGVQVIGDTPWDELGHRLLRVLSQQLEPGSNGMQEIICEGDGYRFKRYEPGYES